MKTDTKGKVVGVVSLISFLVLFSLSLSVILTSYSFKESETDWLLETVCVIFSLGVVFSVLLLVGVTKRKPGLILIYYVFGIIIEIILAIITCLTLPSHRGIIMLLITSTYLGCLRQLHTLYISMRNEQKTGTDKENLVLE